MIDLSILEKKGITQASLKAKLSGDPLQWGNKQQDAPVGNPSPNPNPDAAYENSDHAKVGRLLHRIRSRIQEGMNRNFQDYRVYHALDLAWDAPFRQVTPTLLASLLDKNPNTEEVYKACEQWGMTHLIKTKIDPKSGKEEKVFDFPTFFQVIVPLVRAYVSIRWAKIVNDRRLIPFFSYQPVKLTTLLSLKCDAITDRIEVMSRQMGYFDTMKQAVFKMLHYSISLIFPKEEWYSVSQWKKADEVDVSLERKKEDGTAASLGDDIKVTESEGLRHHVPHPSRVYRDLAHPSSSYNYDNGCEYGGYWQIKRYREIRDGNFWNKDKIALGTMDIMANNRLFFTSVYSACTMTIPTAPQPKVPDGAAGAASVGVGAGNLDREKEIANLYYGTDHGDQGVLVTEHWEKLVPKDNGLGDYDEPVWFRFVVAGDGCTVLYAAPVPYCPIIYYGYDADESRSSNASLSMEVLPFQDQFSNVLTQIILTAKQNLANITFIDEDQLTEETQNRLKNLGEGYYRFLNVFGYSSRKAARGLNRIAEAVQSANLPKGNTAELISVLREILNILERVLVMSSQEVAQAASHELRVDEVRNIAQSTSSRLQFTAIPVDVAQEAWKRQLYQALMSYGDSDFFVHIPAETPLTEETLKKMGFTYVDRDIAIQAEVKDQYRRARISKEKTAIPMWEFASTRDGSDRMDNSKTGAVMVQLMQGILGNPMMAQSIGPDQAIDAANRIFKFMGLPADFKLRNVNPGANEQEQAAQMQEQLKQVLQMVMGEVQKEIKPLLEHEKGQDQQVQAMAQQMEILKQQFALIYQALNIPTPAANGSDQNSIPTPAGNGRPTTPGMVLAPGP